MLDDTIAAIATPPGRGGVGIIRISGPLAPGIARSLAGKLPKPRYAELANFCDPHEQPIDNGIILYFPAPNSFTGEHVIELQGHGGPVVMDLLLQRVVGLGARLAKPGEFSERAFLNDKIDLTQAEAIADLIDSASVQAAQSAVRSLQGDFSKHIQGLVTSLIGLRTYVEAALDFPDEEIDFLSDGKVKQRLDDIIAGLEQTQQAAKQGSLLREGIRVVLAGRPNAGKSSLLNCLSGRDSAIVTSTPGTTRDVVREHIQLNGLPIHVIDTAGLRETEDEIEQEGVKRAYAEMQKADHVLLIVDSTDQSNLKQETQTMNERLQSNIPITVIHNKIDLNHQNPSISETDNITHIHLSAKTQAGIELLVEHITRAAGYRTDSENSGFLARRRHLQALEKAYDALMKGRMQLLTFHAGELLAEELHQAQQSLSEITGEFTSDDLLGEIFSSFCIGK